MDSSNGTVMKFFKEKVKVNEIQICKCKSKKFKNFLDIQINCIEETKNP